MPCRVARAARTASASAGFAGVLWFAAAATHDAVGATATRGAIREGLPNYDPDLRKKYLASLESEKPHVIDDAEAHGVKLGSTEPIPNQPVTTTIVILPRIIVRPRDNTQTPTPVIQLPRLVVRPSVGKDTPAEEFETPEARDARLVKKHLSTFDRAFLNRFTLPLFGISRERRARAAEAAEQSARRLNEIAELVDLSKSEKAETKDDQELREMYLDTLMSRPR